MFLYHYFKIFANLFFPLQYQANLTLQVSHVKLFGVFLHSLISSHFCFSMYIYKLDVLFSFLCVYMALGQGRIYSAFVRQREIDFDRLSAGFRLIY